MVNTVGWEEGEQRVSERRVSEAVNPLTGAPLPLYSLVPYVGLTARGQWDLSLRDTGCGHQPSTTFRRRNRIFVTHLLLPLLSLLGMTLPPPPFLAITPTPTSLPMPVTPPLPPPPPLPLTRPHTPATTTASSILSNNSHSTTTIFQGVIRSLYSDGISTEMIFLGEGG